MSPAGFEPTTYGLKGAARGTPKLFCVKQSARSPAHSQQRIDYEVFIDCKRFCTDIVSNCLYMQACRNSLCAHLESVSGFSTR